jgi:thiol:disulfide interchange protein DsbD
MQNKKWVRAFLVCMLSLALACFAASMSFAAANTRPLPAEKAFRISVSVESTNKINVHWKLAKGYYLYREKLHFSFDPKTKADIHFPSGEMKAGLRHKQYEIYTQAVTVPIVLQKTLSQIQVNIDYQGCSEQGFCYPPMHKAVFLDLKAAASLTSAQSTEASTPETAMMPATATAPATTAMSATAAIPDTAATLNASASVRPAITTTILSSQNLASQNDLAAQASSLSSFSLSSLLTDQNSVRALFASQHLAGMLLIFMALGLLLAFTPCILPMVPILTSIIVGHKEKVSTQKALFLSLTYVLGSSCTYALAGVAAASLGTSLQAWMQQAWIITIVSGLFVLLSLSLFGAYDLHLPRYWQNRITAASRRQKGGTYLGVFIMGVVSTLVVSPCVTAPLIGVLMFIADTGSLALGAIALFAMGLGMGIPLIILGVSTGKWLPRRGPWMTTIQQFFGVLMLGMAVYLLSRVYSATAILAISVVVLLALALFFSFYKSEIQDRQIIHKRLGKLAGISTGFLIFALTASSLTGLFLQPNYSQMPDSAFMVVHNVQELNRQLSAAKALDKPVIVDFYADWCESCVIMDKNVFSKSEVMTSLSPFVLLRVDLSKNTSADETLLKNYDVIAPPAVLFFNAQGREVNSRRIVGELNAHEFLMRVNTFFAANCDKKTTC